MSLAAMPATPVDVLVWSLKHPDAAASGDPSPHTGRQAGSPAWSVSRRGPAVRSSMVLAIPDPTEGVQA